MTLAEQFRQEGMQQGLQQGIQQGLQQGEATLLTQQLIHRFGALRPTDSERLKRASSEQLLR